PLASSLFPYTTLFRSGRLLILDDDPAVGQTIGLLASREGLDYRTTMVADDFFAELERWRPTHIALDLVMPDVDGIEILRRLGARSEEHTSELQSREKL